MATKLDNVPREVFDATRSKRQKYEQIIVGRPGWQALLRYELITLLARRAPGAFGLWLRSRLYPRLLGACGRNVFFGNDVTLRHPHKIRIGDDVVVDDGCVLDAKGAENDGIAIGNGVFLGRQTIVTTKDGDIELEDGVNVSAFCMIFSASRVRCGRNTLIAAYTYLVGGGHDLDRTDLAIIDQARPSQGIAIGPNCWLGAGVTVLDGVTVGRDAVIGANSVVTRDVEDFAVAAGSPAATIRRRAASPAS
ncbi:MAG: acyltransferase [Acidobacteria bacterium]|nr:acyltransferase [Acidobacteriota bacterium]